MKQKHLFALLDTSFTTIRVAFAKDFLKAEADAESVRKRFGSEDFAPQVRTYIYKAAIADNLKEGDHVVVETASAGLTVDKVMEVHTAPQIDVDADFDYKWIVQKVDRTEYDARVKRESDFAQMMLEVERTRQREALVEDMRKNLPEGSRALSLFENATKLVEGAALAAPEGVADAV